MLYNFCNFCCLEPEYETNKKCPYSTEEEELENASEVR